MRPLEVLLLLANLLTFLGLVLPPLRTLSWMRLAAPLALVIAGAQVLLEGWRWQMVPAYALSASFVLVAMGRCTHPDLPAHGTARTRRVGAGLAATLGMLGLVVSSLLPVLIPVFHFPRPDGPYAIGTVTYHWIDSARSEIFTPAPNDRRELMVQLWYPAIGDPSAPRAAYVEHPEALVPLARLFRLPAFTFGYLKYVRTNAMPSAPVAEGGPYPVLLFSHGRGGYRQHNTMQVEALASHGYVVATIDHPYAASGVVFPDGRLAPFDPRMFDPDLPCLPRFVDIVLRFIVRDALFTLDRLDHMERGDPGGILAGHMDLDRAGIFGVSLGGAVAAEACRMDPRLHACLIMDVFMPADVVRHGLAQPTMWISRDSGSMRLEGWGRRDIDETQTTMRTVYRSLPGAGYMVLVPGTFHPNFSDLPLLTPLTKPLGLTGPIDGHRAHVIINAFSLAFFDRHLKGLPAALLDHPSDSFPEVLYRSRSLR